jgi:ribonuclease HII
LAKSMARNLTDLLPEILSVHRKDPSCGLELERKLWEGGYKAVAGVDEVGRGPLAGPVVAACVVFPPSVNGKRFTEDRITGMNDSKKLASGKREELFDLILANAQEVGIGLVKERDIDRLNILNASLTAMQKAVRQLKTPPDFILVDGNLKIPQLAIAQMPIVKGDSLSFSIAAASIIAKVTRDRIMLKYHRKYPEFCFGENKGYGTKAHLDALKTFGPCKIHRLSFKVVQLCRSNQINMEMK